MGHDPFQSSNLDDPDYHYHPLSNPETCEHRTVMTFVYMTEDETNGKVALWACADCRIKFVPKELNRND